MAIVLAKTDRAREPGGMNGREPGPGDASPPIAPHPGPVSLLSTVVTLLGIVVISFVVYQLLVTSLTTSRQQRELAAQMREKLTLAKAIIAATPENEEPALGLENAAAGDPIAVLRIPALGVERVVVEGTGSGETELGPGHHRGSSRPGWPGNALILGRRTTYGHPFRDLNKLSKGDDLVVTTQQGRFVYVVDRVGVLLKGEPDVTARVIGRKPTLTLATAHPPYRASERLLVEATLKGNPVDVPSGYEHPSDLRPDESGVDRDSRAWAGVLGWGQLLLIAVAAAALLYRRYPRWTVWLLTTPVVVALSFLTFESITRLLPSTL